MRFTSVLLVIGLVGAGARPACAAYGEQVLYAFQGGSDGSSPSSGVIADASGALYGTTSDGGNSCPGGVLCGTVYKLTPSGSGYVESVIYRFQGGGDGYSPDGGVVMDAHGALYGTTMLGGGSDCDTLLTTGCGTVYKLTPNGSAYSEQVLYAFQGGPDGERPSAAPIVDGRGNVYGTTAGNVESCGSVYGLTPARGDYREHTLYDFLGGPGDGCASYASLVAGKRGTLFGTTAYGGIGDTPGFTNRGLGTVFRLEPQRHGYLEHVVHFFQGTDGEHPIAGLTKGAEGALFGTTYNGGDIRCRSQTCGTAYELVPERFGYALTVIHSFRNRRHDGSDVLSGLIANAGGDLFGTFIGHGGVYELAPSAGRYSEHLLFVFGGAPYSGGFAPVGNLLGDTDGDLFGATANGGTCSFYNTCGVVYELRP